MQYRGDGYRRSHTRSLRSLEAQRKRRIQEVCLATDPPQGRRASPHRHSQTAIVRSKTAWGLRSVEPSELVPPLPDPKPANAPPIGGQVRIGSLLRSLPPEGKFDRAHRRSVSSRDERRGSNADSKRGESGKMGSRFSGLGQKGQSEDATARNKNKTGTILQPFSKLQRQHGR